MGERLKAAKPANKPMRARQTVDSVKARIVELIPLMAAVAICRHEQSEGVLLEAAEIDACAEWGYLIQHLAPQDMPPAAAKMIEHVAIFERDAWRRTADG